MPESISSVTISTALDNRALEKEYNELVKKIAKLEEKINQKRAAQSPLLEEAKQLSREYDTAAAKLKEMQSGKVYYAPSQISTQKAEIRSIESVWDKVQQKADKLGVEIYDATQETEKLTDRAGTVSRELAESSRNGAKLGDAIESSSKKMDKLTSRLKRLLTNALIFSVITRGFRGLRNWIGDTIKTSDEATAAIAKLKGALLTMVQPLVDIIIPAFITLVNILTKVVTAIAQLFAMLSGKSLAATSESAQALYEQKSALDGVGASAKKAGKSMAAFDEIKQITDTTSDSGSDSGAVASGDIAPDFSDLEIDTSAFDGILDIVLAIGAGLLTWQISSLFTNSLSATAGLALAVAGAVALVTNYMKAWNEGVNLDNLTGMLWGVFGIVAGLGLAFGSVAAGIGAVVAGLALLVLGFKDVIENGANLANTLAIIAGIILTGLGISLITGSFIPALIAGIVALVVAIVAWQGNLEDLIDGLKMMFEGFLLFFEGVFSGDWEKALEGLKMIWEGFKKSITAILDSLSGAFDWVLDWIVDKFNLTGTDIGKIVESIRQIFQGIIRFIKGVFTGDWKMAWEGLVGIFKGIINGVISIFYGIVNLIIKGLNWLIEQMNKIQFDVPDWVPGIGGMTLGINIPKIPLVDIPMLAQGAVIPPNREFLAVLGDQKRGTNIEAPADLIKQLVAEGVAAAGGGGTPEITLHLDGQLAVLARVLRPYLEAEGRRKGVKLVTGGAL